MEIEKALLLTLEAAIAAQFFLSFIKGRSSIKDKGKILLTMGISASKEFIIITSFFGLIAYFLFVIIKGYYSLLGILIVIYFILIIYDFSKKRIVTEVGFGQKSMYSKTIYNFTCWSEITQWEWSKLRPGMLVFQFIKKNKTITKDIDVPASMRKEVEGYFKEYIKLNNE